MADTSTAVSEQDFLDAARRGEIATIRAGLEAGLDADTQDPWGNSALMIACSRGHRDICQALIDAGANAEHKNKFGLGPRQWAEWAENGPAIRGLLS